jgi:alanine dehydrogenase
LPYTLQLASQGWEKATAASAELKKGLNIIKGDIVYAAVKEAYVG